MSITVIRPGDIAIIQLPASWPLREVRREQSRVTRVAEKSGIDAKFIVVAGGAEASLPADVASLLAGDDALADDGDGSDLSADDE